MSLSMKDRCERCEASLLLDGLAKICSYECTFCEPCSLAMKAICPNCQGPLEMRPRRLPKR